MIVYWNMCVGENDVDYQRIKNYSGLRTHAPEPVKDIPSATYNVSGKKSAATCPYLSCPAFKDYNHNLFAIKSPIDYEINISPNNDAVASTTYDQKVFDDLITIRSLPDKLFSISINLNLFTESKSLIISQEAAAFHSNTFVDNTVLVPGKFDIGKWVRPLEVGFHVRGNNMQVKDSEVLYYLRLHTSEKVTFKQFIPTSRYIELTDRIVSTKNLKNNKFSPLSYYYDIIARQPNLKKMLFNEIKDNIVD